MNSICLNAIVIFLISIFNAAVQSDAVGDVICYYGSWAKNRPSNGKFTIDDIDSKYCSIIVYCCIGLNEDTTIKPNDAEGDLPQFTTLKSANPDVKLLMGIGGPNEDTKLFSLMSSSAERRLKFVDSIVAFLVKHKLDGLDFMWEFPNRDGATPVDKVNFVVVLQMLRNKFQGKNWLLTAIVGGSTYLTETSYDVQKMNDILDYINIKTFDYYSPYDPFVYVHSPLYAPENDENRLSLTQSGTITHWLNEGADQNKLILGIASYGRSFQLDDESYHELFDRASGPGLPGPYTAEEGMLSYLEICEKMKDGSYTVNYHDDLHTVSAYKGNQWIGYDNAVSVAEKSRYAKSKQLGGVMLYWIDGDDKNNICDKNKFPLLEAIHSVFPIGDEPPPTTTATTSPSESPAPPTNHIPREKAKEFCLSREHGSSFASPLDACTADYYRCLRIMIDDFVPRSAKCSNSRVFDASIGKCKQKESVSVCDGQST